MRRVKGNLPEGLVYYSRPPIKVHFSWDDADIAAVEVGEVRPTYVSDDKNKKTMETGKVWSANGETFYDPVTEKDIKLKGKKKELQRPNVPFAIKILTLEHRGNGGRAYKVVDADNLYFDLREDVLLDVIKNCTITKGVPDCHFIWGKVGAEMKLVRYGSELYTALIEATELDKQPKLKEADLVPGDVCSSKDGTKEIFIGWCETYEIVTNPDHGAGNGTVTSITKVKAMLWLAYPQDYQIRGKNITNVEQWVKADNCGYYNYKFRKSISFKEKVGHWDISARIFEIIRTSVAQHVELSCQGDDRHNHVTNEQERKRGTIAVYYKELNVRAVGGVDPADVDKYRLRVGSTIY